MSIKERLKSAYENVAFNADKTWIHSSVQFQRANKELFSKECQFRLIKAVELRPRTVKDCIPKSKLAQYSNYEYSEARELSYAPSSSNFNGFMYYSREPENRSCKEPWLLPEVDDLFIWFTNHHHFASQLSMDEVDPKSTLSSEQIYYESPILNADTFDTRLLKMQIVSDKIRNIWKANNTLYDNIGFAKERSLNVYKTPGNIFYLQYDVELASKDSTPKLKSKDFDFLKVLSKAFKEQNCWILRCMAVKSHQVLCDFTSNIGQINTKNDVAPSKRLYSAVLQGLSSSKKPTPNDESSVLLHTTGVDSSEDRLATGSVNCEPASVPMMTDYDIPGPSQMNSYIPSSTHYTEPNKIQSAAYEQLNNLKSSRAKSLNTSSMHANNSNYVQPTLGYNSFQNPVPITSPQYLGSFNYQLNAHYSNSYQSNCIYSNTLTTNMSQIVVSRGVQPLSNQTYFPSTPVIMMQQNRMSSLYPMSHQYIQQSYYSPTTATPTPLQRWLHSDFRGSTMPPQTFPVSVPQSSIPLPPVHWLNQNNHLVHAQNDINRIRNRGRRIINPPSNVPQDNVKYKILQDGKATACSSDVTKRSTRSSNLPTMKTLPNAQQDLQRFAAAGSKTFEGNLRNFDEAVNKNVNALLDDDSSDRYVPVTATMSEELEIQALEQYCNSNDNVYQELERQAEEEYEEHSENWGSPPNNSFHFGGLQVQWNYA